MLNILEEQLKAERENRHYALVTLVKTTGTTPRSAGSKMLVFPDGSCRGTIGGGVLEKQVTADAVSVIESGQSVLKEYENRPAEAGAPCGGIITAFIEAGSRAPRLVVCGAGHVGGIIIRMAGELGYHVTAIDTRDTELTKEYVKTADRFILADSFREGMEAAGGGADTFYMVSTYGHKEDCEALEAVLLKDSAYIGMMGSSAKINAIFQKLRERGITEEQLSRVYAPVGLDIGGDTPPEIALSVLAQMQLVRYAGSGRALKER